MYPSKYATHGVVIKWNVGCSVVHNRRYLTIDHVQDINPGLNRGLRLFHAFDNRVRNLTNEQP